MPSIKASPAKAGGFHRDGEEPARASSRASSPEGKTSGQGSAKLCGTAGRTHGRAHWLIASVRNERISVRSQKQPQGCGPRERRKTSREAHAASLCETIGFAPGRPRGVLEPTGGSVGTRDDRVRNGAEDAPRRVRFRSTPEHVQSGMRTAQRPAGRRERCSENRVEATRMAQQGSGGGLSSRSVANGLALKELRFQACNPPVA